MNALEIYKYIEEKGYDHSKIYKVADGDEGDLYCVRIFKDYPKDQRGSQYYYGPDLINLFYNIQEVL